MYPSDLNKILKEIPILMSPILEGYDKGEFRTAEGMAIQKTREDGSEMKYTVLNYNCDNMVNTLLHESIHHWYGGVDEKFVEDLTDFFFKDPQYMKQCQRKVVELCGRYDL